MISAVGIGDGLGGGAVNARGRCNSGSMFGTEFNVISAPTFLSEHESGKR
jgi:hypothetical protein